MGTIIVVGEPSSAAELAQTFKNAERARIWGLEPLSDARDPASSAELARALEAFETEVKGQEADSIVLADDSETALAAALVATKLLLPLLAAPRARDAGSPNGRVIAQLAAAYTPAA